MESGRSASFSKGRYSRENLQRRQKETNVMTPTNTAISLALLTQPYTYSLLRTYAYYRALLSSLLLLMFTANLATKVFGSQSPTLYFYTSIVYTLITCTTLVWLWRTKAIPTVSEISITLIIDIVAIVLLMSASGGTDSSLGYLLLVCVAVGGIFGHGQISYAYAAGATVLVLAESAYQIIYQQAAPDELYYTGVLGILLFLSNAVFRYLADKIIAGQIEADRQAQYAKHLQEMAESIIERMRTGVIVVDAQDHILLINQAALNLLGVTYQADANLPNTLSALPDVCQKLNLWREDPEHRFKPLNIEKSGFEARISFAPLDRSQHSDTLVFLEDNRLIAQEAQHLKLASLGRLTASIAHEIRNPLGAISHASQLLNESPSLPDADKRLANIITNHTQRINQIIENTLNLSRRKGSQAEAIDLAPWIKQFCHDYVIDKNAEITVTIDEDNICTRFDASHLRQIMTNLVENGLRYSEQATGNATLTIRISREPNRQLPCVDIIDDGQGMSAEQAEHVFEPFYTTETRGSGLGLYICRELCETNHASIRYQRTESGNSAFRIIFSHEQKMF